ncbi:hypothetical protein TWF225_008296 [Orbilia oligospora]|uniref:Manganese lipoxygenase n=1 Tax=Orbilia oligospora TaxID=2813651 RepID=A0A7C8PYI6_ORBOL|nr:hypothetical protein TWF751_000213 [Orbilia oligospora]KAF3194130.1 hypothetical protein TWF225_008296 [Orbilia oligospora]KAF3254731.1 hypothetical protein TWF128_006053 [Orbilia oligospora]KAF3269028.1 hypothetical protein TWF217_010301 [Orbilia oligospora]KAF3290516.1 hypothetical protein TWF132_006843 [Orbilia oligospora]
MSDPVSSEATPGFSTDLPVAPPDASSSVPIDPGVFNNRMRGLGLGLSRKHFPNLKHGGHSFVGAPSFAKEEEKIPIQEASFEDTALRLKLSYQQILTKFGSLHDFFSVDSSVPTDFEIEDKRELYKWSNGNDGYPPHLNVIPPGDVTKFDDIFHASYLFYFQLGEMLAGVFPSLITGINGAPWNTFSKNTLSGLQEINANLIDSKTGIYTEANIGLREDWYTDEQFAQQHLTGPNPTTLALASDNWIQSFRATAEAQGKNDFIAALERGSGSIYIQDYSYFKKAAAVDSKHEFSSEKTTRFGKRYTGASVALFVLGGDGKLHPLAIVIDYKEDDIKKENNYFVKSTGDAMSNSVVIFNKRTSSTDSTATEAEDWPWRYAKTCVQVCDWHRHEVGVHLVRTHLVEEAVIVGAERSFSSDHIVYQLLNPHWLKTLSLNQAARETLVPKIILNIAGMDKKHLSNYLKTEYYTFHWEDLYIPNDLERRGFPVSKLNDDKFRNYPYGRNMVAMWFSIRKFVQSMLEDYYAYTKTTVEEDEQVKSWVKEMQDDMGARLTSFPTITTMDQLVDAVTMCIHIASPQHTAVNYLQEYYQVFVPNKPSCLAHPLPGSLPELEGLKESDILAALPLDKGNVWLMSAYIPHLLSMSVIEDQNIITYAKTELLYRQGIRDEAGAKAAQAFLDDLEKFKTQFQENSASMNVETAPPGLPGTSQYTVMDPRKMAVSILI